MHNTIHYLEFLKEKESNPNLRWALHEDFVDHVGVAKDPCMFCLGTEDCNLNPVKSSYGKSYIACPDSCKNGRYDKLSAVSVDSRRFKQFKRSKRSLNLCSNRPIICRVPGCEKMFWCSSMSNHYKVDHVGEAVPEDLLLTEREKVALLKHKDFFFGANYMILKAPKMTGLKSAAPGVGKQRSMSLLVDRPRVEIPGFSSKQKLNFPDSKVAVPENPEGHGSGAYRRQLDCQSGGEHAKAGSNNIDSSTSSTTDEEAVMELKKQLRIKGNREESKI